MNLVDSSGWLEYFADGPNASFFSRSIQDLGRLVVATLSIFEVFKRIAGIERRVNVDAFDLPCKVPL